MLSILSIIHGRAAALATLFVTYGYIEAALVDLALSGVPPGGRARGVEDGVKGTCALPPRRGGGGVRGVRTHPSAHAPYTQLQTARETARARVLLAAVKTAHAREVQVETRPDPVRGTISRRLERAMFLRQAHKQRSNG